MTDHLNNINKSPVFSPEKRSQAFWTYHENRPLRAGELVNNQQIQEYERQRLIDILAPSGFLQVGDRTIKDRSISDIQAGDIVVGSSGSDADRFYIYAPDEQYKAIVNGWPITLYNIHANGASSSPGDDYISIGLSSAPSSGSRFDLVFLEVWREELNSSDTIYPWGNVDTEESIITNDIDDNRYSGSINSIVAIRSRIRVVDNIDYANNPLGMTDSSVTARGGGSSSSSLSFSYQGRGLWRAGDGNSSSRTALNSTDGYVYSIPIAVIFRRNQSNWNAASNPNGAEAIGTTATRPDGLSYNEIEARDIDDIRTHALLQHDFEGTTRQYRDLMARNTLRLGLRQEGTVWGNEILKIESFSGNGSRRTWFGADGLDKVPSEIHSATFTISGSIINGIIIEDREPILSDFPNNGDRGVVIEGRSRSIANVVRRSGNNINNHTLASGDSITINYSYRPSLTPTLPTTLSIEMLYVEPTIITSNLGTGGGNKGQPYLNPLIHVPESTSAHAIEPTRPDDSLNNSSDLTISDFGGNWGNINMPALFQMPWDLINTLSSSNTDNEDRTYYGASNSPYMAMGQVLAAGQWHRTAQFGLAKIKTTNGVFLKDELILICFSETTDSINNRVGIDDAAGSLVVGVYPLRIMV